MKFESIQAVLFSNGTANLNAASAWGMISEQSFRAFNTNPANPQMTIASGHINGLAVDLTVQPGRIDVLVKPIDALVGPPSPLPPLFDDVNTPLSIAANILERLSFFPLPTRVALVAQAMEASTNASDANVLVGHLLPGLSVPSDSRDFSYQLNRPVTSEGFLINRLCRWSVSNRQVMLVHVGPGGSHQQVTSSESAFTTDIYYDVNSVPAEGALAQPVVSRLIGSIYEQLQFLIRDGYAALAQ